MNGNEVEGIRYHACGSSSLRVTEKFDTSNFLIGYGEVAISINKFGRGRGMGCISKRVSSSRIRKHIQNKKQLGWYKGEETMRFVYCPHG